MDGDSLPDPLIIGTFEKRAPGPLMQGKSFRVVKKKINKHVSLTLIYTSCKEAGQAHYWGFPFKHFSCRFLLSRPVSVYYVIISIKQYISVQGYKEIFIIYLSNFQFYHWRQEGVSGPVLCVNHSHAIRLFWSDWLIRGMSLLLVFLSAPLVNKRIWK